MSTWSLPATHLEPVSWELPWLFEHWSSAKTWSWLRDNRLDRQDPALLSRLARYAFKDLGISPLNLANAWNAHAGEMVSPWSLSYVSLPASPTETWPDQAQVLSETSLGLLSALVANGWNAFEPFLPMIIGGKDPHLDFPTEIMRPAWGVEIVMGLIPKTRLDEHWRLCLVDQMLRSAHCPPIEELIERRVCKTKKGGAPVSWFQAAMKYRLPVVARACVDHGIHAGIWEDWPLHMPDSDRAWWQSCLLERVVGPADAARAAPRLRL